MGPHGASTSMYGLGAIWAKGNYENAYEEMAGNERRFIFWTRMQICCSQLEHSANAEKFLISIEINFY